MNKLLLIAICLCPLGTVAADENKTPVESSKGSQLFAVRILPLLKEKCFACHGANAKDIKGGLDLRSRAGLLKGGESDGPAIVAGHPKNSPLINAIKWLDREMPPKENDRLTAEQIRWFEQWVSAKAPWPSNEEIKRLQDEWNALNDVGELVETSGGLSDSWTNRRYRAEDLWAYRPIAQHDPPARFLKAQLNPRRHPIDAFVNQRLAQAGLEPAGEAEKVTLIRRATFDLTGLPPTPDEVKDFLNDSSDRAFERVVDRLLASKRYGEQMARHWLDVVRYADTAGFSNDFDRPNAWRYRDYVIRSFNLDKPYNKFVEEQLAGDELDENNPENLIAVGFLRMGPWEHTGMSVEAVTRQQYLDDITNNVGESLLAHSLRCCKCHDHKFDPLPTRDYYRFQAIFATLQFADRDVAFLETENQSNMQEGRARFEKLRKDPGIKLVIEPDATPEQKKMANLGVTKVIRRQVGIYDRQRFAFEPMAFSVYSGAPVRYISNKLVHPIQKRNGKPQEIFILTGGALESPGAKVSPGVLSATQLKAAIPNGIEGRRTALAKWVTDKRNPLTARVIVNRVWQWHFGMGLAANANNFGKTGAKPTHPRLLDWLASRFVADGWSIKKLHRLVMTSSTYQRSSEYVDAKRLDQIDPDNKLLAHFRPRRLSAEELRDSMLLVSGELNLSMGGVPIRPVINREVAQQPRHLMGSVAPAYQPSRTPAERNRRTIYAIKIRTLRDPMMEVFDQPGPDVSCEKRDASTISPQVFSLFNSQVSYDRALAMAKSLLENSADLAEAIDAAFQRAFARNPSDEELRISLAHVRKLTAHHEKNPPQKVLPPRSIVRTMIEEMTGLVFQWEEQLDVFHNYVDDVKPWDVDAATRALADLCLVLMNSNEFIYVY